MILPLGVEGGSVRFPLAGLGILTVCVALFAVTWPFEASPMGIDVPAIRAAVDYWAAHPWLELPEEFRERELPADMLKQLNRQRSRLMGQADRPEEEEVAHQQRTLDALCDVAVQNERTTLFRLLALEPRRGLVQPGWLTYLFLHAGWWHLLGNMLFLYAVALVLEDAWGRWRFLAFYLLGGSIAGAAEFLMHPKGLYVLVGASGAVAACIGATTVRFARRRMRLSFSLLFSFGVPVWLWGVFWALGEVSTLLAGTQGSVAVLAHVVGVFFGMGVALVMKLAGLDRALLATDELGPPTGLSQSFAREVELGHEALSRGDRGAAREHFERALERDHNDTDALTVLMGMELRDGERRRAAGLLERAVSAFIQQRLLDRAAEPLFEGLQRLKVTELTPAFALFAVQSLDPQLPPEMRVSLWVRAGAHPGPDGLQANLTGIELALEARDVDAAREVLGRLTQGQYPPQVARQVWRARERLQQLEAESFR